MKLLYISTRNVWYFVYEYLNKIYTFHVLYRILFSSSASTASGTSASLAKPVCPGFVNRM